MCQVKRVLTGCQIDTMHTLCEQRRRANEQNEQNDNKLLVTWRFPGVFELFATEISTTELSATTEHEEFRNGKYLFRTDELPTISALIRAAKNFNF